MVNIREILEQQGIIVKIGDVTASFITVVIEDTQCVRIVNVSMTKDLEYAKELASRQYVKENGFKLEWFDDERVQSWIKEKLDPNWHYKWCELNNEELLFRLLELSIDQFEDKYTKIFAWLYAENVEVVE